MFFSPLIEQDINKKILSLSYDEFSVEIISVDAQESYGGAVLILVTGFMIGKDNMKQKFTQCFFLAPQKTGYFVLNDIFRYVDENENQGSFDDAESPVTPDNGNVMQKFRFKSEPFWNLLVVHLRFTPLF